MAMEVVGLLLGPITAPAKTFEDFNIGSWKEMKRNFAVMLLR
jgi:hypothetical protein